MMMTRLLVNALLLSPLMAFRSPLPTGLPPRLSFSRLGSVVSRQDEIAVDVDAQDSHLVTNRRTKQSGRAKHNTAMSDPIFVRKRTTTLLDVTSDGIPDESKRRGLKIDKKTFDWLLDAWAYSNQTDSADMALQLLDRMERLKSTNVKLTPNVKTYTKAIKVIALSGDPNAGTRAEELLNQMIHSNDLAPNTLTYTYVIDAYSRSSSRDAPKHAQRLVEAMETARLAGQDVKPTARAWNSVIKALSVVSAEQASACLDIMEKLAHETGNKEVQPNSYNCNSVISAYAKSGEPGSAAKAELILQKMERFYQDTGDERLKPRTETFNAIIDAYAKSGEVNSPRRAEMLLSYMMELYETGQNVGAKPNLRSFNSILNAWAKSGDINSAENAVNILNQMEEFDGSELNVYPDATSYATVIYAFARSLNYGKADSAYELYQKMKNLYEHTGNEALRPNNIVYNSVLNACAFAIGDIAEQGRAIHIASVIFSAIRESKHEDPDEVTYGTYLKVICNQMPQGKQRKKIVQAIFSKAIDAGMVGYLVLRQVKKAGLDDIVIKMYFGTQALENIDLKDLPESWTRNVLRTTAGTVMKR